MMNNGNLHEIEFGSETSGTSGAMTEIGLVPFMMKYGGNEGGKREAGSGKREAEGGEEE